MKRLICIVVILLTAQLTVLSQTATDSLVRLQNLKFHSAFEKEAIYSFLKDSNNAFNVFLAIDENMSFEEAKTKREIYRRIFADLENKGIEKKKPQKKIKLIYNEVHDRFLKKYNDNQYFPVIFESGNYNCVSASMVYALVFDSLAIPYKVSASSSHVYLVANPGENSVVIETTNPGFEKAIFTGQFKQQYVNYLRSSKLISDNDYRSKSTEEIFEEKFKEVKTAKFTNFPGFQYYNKSLINMQDNNMEEALILAQKAYFFYPDNQVKTLLFNALLFQIEKCNFDQVSDIDYISQYSRFENSDRNVVVAMFNNIINHHLKYINKESYCDSLFLRLSSELTDDRTKEEVAFAYNMQMSYHFARSPKVEKYIVRAMELKGNFHDAILIMENYLNSKLYAINNPYELLDTINVLQSRWPFETIYPLYLEHKSMAKLSIAKQLFEQKKMTLGDKYLREFEIECETPVKNQLLSANIESTYRLAAKYFYYKGEKLKAEGYNKRGLKFVPNSVLLGSPVY